MSRLIRLRMLVTLAWVVSYTAFGQSAPKIPNVDISTPNRGLDLRADDVCAIDFKNIKMFGEDEHRIVRLKDGKYMHESDGSRYERARLDHAFCFKRSDGGNRALVMTDWLICIGIGNCANLGIVQLFELRASQPVIIQQLLFNSMAEGTRAEFDEKSLTLTIAGRSNDGSPSCCAKSLDVVTYQFEQALFKLSAYKRIPAPESPILLFTEYDEFDFDRGSSTCLTVFRDGRFQMGQASYWPGRGSPKFYEDSLSDDSLKALHSVLEARDLVELNTLIVVTQFPFAIRRGESLSGFIQRERTRQELRLMAVQVPAGPAPKKLPASVGPLVQWIEATREVVHQRKLRPLEGAKSEVNCWIAKPQ